MTFKRLDQIDSILTISPKPSSPRPICPQPTPSRSRNYASPSTTLVLSRACLQPLLSFSITSNMRRSTSNNTISDAQCKGTHRKSVSHTWEDTETAYRIVHGLSSPSTNRPKQSPVGSPLSAIKTEERQGSSSPKGSSSPLGAIKGMFLRRSKSEPKLVDASNGV